MRLAVAVEVLEQVLARQVLHLAHQPREPRVADRRLAQLAALGLEAQLELVARDLGVALAQRGRAEALVRLGVALVADADRAEIEQPHDARHHPLARQRAAREVLGDPLAHLGQQPPELGAAVELLGLLPGAELGVVAVLLAPARIDPGGEQVAAVLRAEPGIGIGRRQRDRVEPVDLVAVGDPLARRDRNRPSRARPSSCVIPGPLSSTYSRAEGFAAMDRQQRPPGACGSAADTPFPREPIPAGALADVRRLHPARSLGLRSGQRRPVRRDQPARPRARARSTSCRSASIRSSSTRSARPTG